jgi:hypothetical protein
VLQLDEVYEQRDGKAGVDSYGLRVFWCFRGSSSEEGMHGHLNQLIKGGNTGPELAQVTRGSWVEQLLLSVSGLEQQLLCASAAPAVRA